VRDPAHRKRSEIRSGEGGAAIVEAAPCSKSPPRGHDLDVEQVGGSQPLTGEPVPMSLAVEAIIGQRRHDDAGVDDDQRESRSARTAFTASRDGTWPPAR